jgi:small conductance mechanosensitive channel
VTEKGKTAINRILAAKGEHAEVALAADPHTQAPGERTPDLSAS